jgi:hypothetical protein
MDMDSWISNVTFMAATYCLCGFSLPSSQVLFVHMWPRPLPPRRPRHVPLPKLLLALVVLPTSYPAIGGGLIFRLPLSIITGLLVRNDL